MSQMIEIVDIEPPESMKFVSPAGMSTSTYLVYSVETSIVPSSFDQVIKNNNYLFSNTHLITNDRSLIPSTQQAF